MPTKEPLYFKNFRKHIDKQFGNIDKKFGDMDEKFDSIDKKFDNVDKKFDNMDEKFEGLKQVIEREVEGLAIMTAKEFSRIDGRFDQIEEKLSKHDMDFQIADNRLDRLESNIVDIKDSIGKIEGHIGRYEVRSTNIEQILLQDHKPRISALEKEALGV